MKILVSVRNWVTRIATLPGTAVRGMNKLKNDDITIKMVGM